MQVCLMVSMLEMKVPVVAVDHGVQLMKDMITSKSPCPTALTLVVHSHSLS